MITIDEIIGIGVGPNMNLTAGSEQGDETVSMVSDTW